MLESAPAVFLKSGPSRRERAAVRVLLFLAACRRRQCAALQQRANCGPREPLVVKVVLSLLKVEYG